ncbi:unnamed protein product, partial [marine sediment metagenome]
MKEQIRKKAVSQLSKVKSAKEQVSSGIKQVSEFEKRVSSAKAQVSKRLEQFKTSVLEQAKARGLGQRRREEITFGLPSLKETEFKGEKLSDIIKGLKTIDDPKTAKLFKEIGVEFKAPPVPEVKLPKPIVLAITPAIGFKQRVIESFEKGQAKAPRGADITIKTGRGLGEAIKEVGTTGISKTIGILKREGVIAPEVKLSDVLEQVELPQLSVPERKKVEQVIETEKRREAGAISGITEITQVRPPSIEDIGKGILAPKQEAEIKANDIILKLNQGKISESKANADLKEVQKDFVDAETNRQLIAIAGTSLGLTAISIAAPPIGIAIGGLAG